MRLDLALFMIIVCGPLLAGAGQAAAPRPGRQLCPDPTFAQGLACWHPYPQAQVVEVAAGPAAHAVEIDARGQRDEAGVVSDDIPVVPLTRYRLGGMVQHIAGHGRYKISLQWLDAERKHVGYENSWTGILAGPRWEQHQVEVLAPPPARFARVLAGVEAGAACRMTLLDFTPLPPAPPRLAIDLLVDPPPAQKLTLRLENRQGATARDVRVQVNLPAGLQAEGPLAFRAGDLPYDEVWRQDITLTGAPRDPEDPIRCRVTATFNGKPAVFLENTRPFVTVASEVETPTRDLHPRRPAMDLKLGCYYFPVMLDWDRAGWGVKHTRFRPRLGFYDEALPEVADWHITWAREHGISFFVFDWYYNQGMCYLNDALEKGFLGSRFSNEMQFCLDWCNEGQCQEFKQLDFSTQTLSDLMHLLCRRYFSRPNYLRVEGKPVVLIHQANRIADAHGGWEGCRRALESMRAIARQYGHPGVYFVAVQNNAVIPPYARGGFEAVTAYSYGFAEVPWEAHSRALAYPDLLPRYRERWAEAQVRANRQGLAYIPTAWAGWDDDARAHEKSIRTLGNTPAALRRMVEKLPDYADRKLRLALVEAWNEWGEGTMLEPGTPYGFGMVSAVRDALTRNRGPYQAPVPSAAEVARLGTDLTCDGVNDLYYRRYAAGLGFDRSVQLDFGSPSEVWLMPWGYVNLLGWRGDAMVMETTGEDPVLLGPPAMGLQAAGVRAISLRMAVSAGKEGQLFWSTAPKYFWSEEASLRFRLIADGKMHEYLIPVGDHPRWTGTIDRFRFDPTDAPAHVEIDWLHTIPAGG